MAGNLRGAFHRGSMVAGVQEGYRPPEYETVKGEDGEFVQVPRRTLTLLEKLMVRNGSMAAPAPAPVKRGRGRPRKEVQA